jgi:hypothetical protein
MNAAEHASIAGRSGSGIRWRQVLPLLALDLAILLSWIAYNEYQPRLVDRFGYGSNALLFLVLQVLIMVVTPPLAGYFTDRLMVRGVARLAVVNLGVSMAAMVFMATAFTLGNPAVGLASILLPMLIVLWLISMNIFHGPAISMLELCAPASLLPGVASLFALLAGLAGALEPSIAVLLDALGAPAAFAAGGVFVFLAGFWFLRSSRGLEARQAAHGGLAEASGFGWIVAMGLVLGLGETLMNDLLPVWIARQGDLIAGLSPPWQSSVLYGLAALTAWPLGLAGNRLHADRLAISGGLAGLALGAAAWVLPGGFAHAALWVFPAAYSALAVAALPVAFARLTPDHKVLGIGLLFSGVEFARGAVKLALNG